MLLVSGCGKVPTSRCACVYIACSVCGVCLLIDDAEGLVKRRGVDGGVGLAFSEGNVKGAGQCKNQYIICILYIVVGQVFELN